MSLETERAGRRVRLRLLCAIACAGIVALAGSLSGCSLAPPYTAPPLPVENAYPPDAPATSGTRGAADLAWRDYFASAALQAMIADALEYNRDLRVAVLRVLDARAYYQIRRADQFPTVDATGAEFGFRVPSDFSVTGNARDENVYAVGGVATWEIDFWGRVRSLKGAALDAFLGTDAARRAATVSLVAEVANAYLSLRELDERSALARETVKTREESLRIFTRRFEVGTTTRLDVAQVETLLTEAQTIGAQLEQARAAQAHALALLLGTAEPSIADRANLEDTTIVEDLHVGLPSDLLVQRPDVIAAEYRLKAANANIGAARAAFFPNVTLTGFGGTASDALSGLFDSGSRAWLYMPQLTLPIFDTGRRRANLDLAEVRRDAAVADYERTVQSAFRDVADALSARYWLTEQVAIQRRALAAQQQRARLAQLRYDAGSASYLEVLDAQRDLLGTAQSLVRYRRELLSSRVALYAALGGGSLTYGESPPPNSRYSADTVTR
ncbi:MAG TPA: efflux transporter outer membrane subunit [Pseudomonadales bacterium]|nr:efflux transporter outer membrane subunit [Pseudomonadales bacterium]